MRKHVAVWVGAAVFLATISFYCTGLAMDWPPLGRFSITYYPAIRVIGIAANGLWLLTAVASPFFLRWRALWLLVSLPIMLFWPYAVYEMMVACAANIRACP